MDFRKSGLKCTRASLWLERFTKGEFIISATPSLIRAAAGGDAQAVRRLLSDGADVNGTNPGGQTALILAALMGRADIVRLLLEAGADVRRRDNLGLTAIDWAQRKGFSDVTQLLVSFSTTTRSVDALASRQPGEDREFRDRDRAGNKSLSSESESRESPAGSQSKADGGFGPAAIAMLRAKASNREATVSPSTPTKKENISSEPIQDGSSSSGNVPLPPKLANKDDSHKSVKENVSADDLWWNESFGGDIAHDTSSAEPETLRARMETERIFEEARLRVEQEVRKKTQEQPGSTFDKDTFEEESSPTRKTASESITRRCPKCNAVYDDGFRMYCAYDAGRLVDVESPVEGAGTSTFGRSALWVLVAITLVGSVVITYFVTSYFIKQEVNTPPAAAATEKAPNTEENSPVIGGGLVGKELNVPMAEFPSTARTAGTSGTVTVVVRVNRNGRVTSARALNGDAQLRTAAERAARQATFSPEKLANEGRNVAGTITYTFKP